MHISLSHAVVIIDTYSSPKYRPFPPVGWAADINFLKMLDMYGIMLGDCMSDWLSVYLSECLTFSYAC